MVSLKEFQALDLRVAEILSVDSVEGSSKLYALQADVGGRQVQMVAGLKGQYAPEDLKGRKVIVVANLEPAKIRGVTSEAMLLAAVDSGGSVSLLTVDKDASVGSKVM